MDIVGVDTAVFGVDDLEAARRFCRDYGFKETEHGTAGASFETLDGTGVMLRHASDSSLPRAPVGGSTGRETIWGVRDKAALEKIGAELSGDRQVRRDAAGVLHTTDDDGLAIAFQVTKRHAYDAKPKLQNIPGLPPQRPINSRVDFSTLGEARSVGHIVYWSEDPDRSMKFYLNRLGFRMTDHVGNKAGVFARAAGSRDHHNLFFIGKPGATTSFQHLECHFADFQEVVVTGSYISQQGWKTARGPGRHVMGSNYYWYFVTPMGGAMELSADIDQIDDNWVPGEWNTLADMAGWVTTFGGPVKPDPIGRRA
ncbi:MAG TPA: VOC family protein [Stellaceae bacterium]|nr:VOC family protein [Stellaceae bacterium]